SNFIISKCSINNSGKNNFRISASFNIYQSYHFYFPPQGLRLLHLVLLITICFQKSLGRVMIGNIPG
ncbi:hypothetical protein, partial [Epilithonimonas hominis]|uniref:hypothetical protein n=1 Tax=Epilithonimonas hominis TaxID=420404 RepID=UPI001C882C8E